MADLKELTIDGVTRANRPAHYATASADYATTVPANTLKTSGFITLTEPGYYFLLVTATYLPGTETGIAIRMIGHVTDPSQTTPQSLIRLPQDNTAQAVNKCTVHVVVDNPPQQFAGAFRSSKAFGGGTVRVYAIKMADLDD